MADTTIHLCDTCCLNEVPDCIPDNAMFGNGKTNDNIIQCENYISPLHANERIFLKGIIMDITTTESEKTDFKYFEEDGQLKRIYKEEYISRRVKEWETQKIDPYLERIRQSWAENK